MANFNDEKSPAVLNFFDMSSEVCRFYMGKRFMGFFRLKRGQVVCKLTVLVYVINKYHLFLLPIKGFCVF